MRYSIDLRALRIRARQIGCKSTKLLLILHHYTKVFRIERGYSQYKRCCKHLQTKKPIQHFTTSVDWFHTYFVA